MKIQLETAKSHSKLKSIGAYWNRPDRAAYIFLTPTLIILTLFVLIPLIGTIAFSFTNINQFFTNTQFVGINNYIKMANDPRVWNAFGNTFKFTLMEVPIQICFGLIISAILAKEGLFYKFTRSAYFIPVVCSMTSISIMWGLILDSNLGIIPYYIFKLGLGKPLMLRDPFWALPIVALMTVWKNFGQTMIILTAGIFGISASLYEAARVDGANKVQMFFRITIPQLIPTLSFCVITNIIGSMQVFDQVYVATRGGPSFKTETAVMYMYSRGFVNNELGYSATIASTLFTIIAIIALILVFAGNKVEGE